VTKALTRARLVTLVGVGGIGKTRLSLQVAADTLDDHADGVWFVELAPIADHRAVTHAVAKVLGRRGGTGPSARRRHRAMGRRQAAAPRARQLRTSGWRLRRLAEQLLRGTAGVKVLASSREPLRIAAEVVYPVPTLGVPESDKPDADATYSRYPAVRLFAERAVRCCRRSSSTRGTAAR
jgi:predicted ATPase